MSFFVPPCLSLCLFVLPFALLLVSTPPPTLPPPLFFFSYLLFLVQGISAASRHINNRLCASGPCSVFKYTGDHMLPCSGRSGCITVLYILYIHTEIHLKIQQHLGISNTCLLLSLYMCERVSACVRFGIWTCECRFRCECMHWRCECSFALCCDEYRGALDTSRMMSLQSSALQKDVV